MRPHRARMSVVFPEPLGPSRPNTSLGRMFRLTRSTAVKVPNRMVTSWTTTASGGIASVDARAMEGSVAWERQVDLGRHAGFEDLGFRVFWLRHADLHAEHLKTPLVHALDIPRRELAGGVD